MNFNDFIQLIVLFCSGTADFIINCIINNNINRYNGLYNEYGRFKSYL